MTSEMFTDRYWDRAAELSADLRADGAAHPARLPNGVTVWVVSRYDQASAALTDHRLSKDAADLSRIMRQKLAEAGQPTELSGMFNPHMLFADDPAHARLRRLVAAQFTRARIEALRPRIAEITRQLVQALPADEPVDLITGLAFPLPVTVICDLLGVPVSDRAPFRDWTSGLMQDDPAVNLPASQAMAAYFTRLIGTKRATPGDDLLSALVAADGDDDLLTDAELLGTVFLLFVGGHETTTNLIGNAVRWLVDKPLTWRALSADPTLLPHAVEEMLRYDSPVRLATHRFTTEPVTFGEVTIPGGEIVMIGLGSANRDERRFPFADELDLQRDPGELRGHLAFGRGMHYCLGAALGRAEAEIALGELASRFPDARLAGPPAQMHRQPSPIMNGYREVRVLLAPS
jgi:cytochrome P450